VTVQTRRLLRIEAKNAETPIEAKPPWIKTRLSTGPNYRDLRAIMTDQRLPTVCQSAGCPNIFECWEDREATFLIGGQACTRRCDFCLIDSAKPTGLDRSEPDRVAQSVAALGLRHATVTGVCRDDLDDQGAWLYAETVRAIHRANPGVTVELLAPDFSGRHELLDQVFAARPEVFAHNLETVPRLFRRIRPAFSYDRSLEVLTWSVQAGLMTKSNLILGLGETRAEVSQALVDLFQAGARLITITQYLRPGPTLHPVARWVTPAEFEELAQEASELGYLGVASGPLVRSSYRAGRLYRAALNTISASSE
jgi:lipoic acid synthetase